MLTLDKHTLLTIVQKNEKVFFEVDREIEFELIAKSFDIRCEVGNSTTSRVMVNEFHQFYCVYDRGARVDSRAI